MLIFGIEAPLSETGVLKANKMAAQSNLTISTYNLHGLNQGRCFLNTLCDMSDVVYVQEHWLALFDLHLLYNIGDDFICYASSAMDTTISTGCLKGRPYGGVAIFVKKSLGVSCKLVKAASRYIILLMGHVLLINVYLPSASTPDRSEELIECLASILNDVIGLQ